MSHVLSWVVAVVIFDSPFTVAGVVWWRRRRRHSLLRARIRPYSHLAGSA